MMIICNNCQEFSSYCVLKIARLLQRLNNVLCLEALIYYKEAFQEVFERFYHLMLKLGTRRLARKVSRSMGLVNNLKTS